MLHIVRLFVFFSIAFALFSTPIAGAQESAAETDADQQQQVEESKIPEDAFGRSTPRGAVEGFLMAAEEGDFERAVEYMDLRNLPRQYRSYQPTKLASAMAIVLERHIWFDHEDLSNHPDGKSGDGLPDYRDELVRIDRDGGEVVLLLQRVPSGDGEYIWKISNATVAKLQELYAEFGYGPITEAVVKALPDVHFLGFELFKWVLTIGGGLMAYPIVLMLGLGVSRLIIKRDSPMYPRVRRFFTGPIALLIVALFMTWIVSNLGVGISAQKIFRAKTLDTIILVWVLFALIGLIRDAYASRLNAQGRVGAVVLLRPASNAIRAFVLLTALLVWLDNIGFNITTLLAGLGVGGVAVALALQKPLEDVFAALTLYTQQPIRIGDFCKVADQTGTVEEIGLRTTRVRTLSNTLLSIPNAKFANEYIENLSARQKILYNPTLRLRCDASPEAIEKVLSGIRVMLTGHQKVVQENPRIRFQTIGKDALELNIFAYAETQDFAEYLEIAEDLNIKVLKIISEAGTSLALPAQTLHIEQSAAD